MVFRKGSTHEFSAIWVRHWKPAPHSVKLKRHVRNLGSKTEVERKRRENHGPLAKRRWVFAVHRAAGPRQDGTIQAPGVRPTRPRPR